MLGLSSKRVYEYVEDGRLPSARAAHVIMIPLEAVKQFRPKLSGRPRTSLPVWRISPEGNRLLSTFILIQILPGQQAALTQRLEEIRQSGMHQFPGTVARYILASETHPGRVEILLIWRTSVMPDEQAREQTLKALKNALDDVLDWNTAEYNHSQVLMHT